MGKSEVEDGCMGCDGGSVVEKERRDWWLAVAWDTMELLAGQNLGVDNDKRSRLRVEMENFGLVHRGSMIRPQILSGLSIKVRDPPFEDEQGIIGPLEESLCSAGDCQNASS
ncbi:unnamed protein product [Sphenostylis stenocarpa]|uniref:Uncharacterized protein n=1 Tax=Sphenostylis stenocarpa TaxID=92480 RepID=A0AA86VM56_9FABA|nr:unnamed protein product [Sphenostylis stenocarpa]